MEYYQQRTSTEFWNEFSNDGKRMSFTEISAALRAQRDIHATQLASEARKRFGNGARFAELFGYKKTGQTRVQTKDAAIAKRYEKLLAKGITR